MRRILLIVVMLLIAAPVMAEVIITASPVEYGVAGNTLCSCVAVDYNCTAGEKIRAFALDVTVDNNFVIQAIRDFNKGETSSKTPNKFGYGIFPGSFKNYINAADPCWTDPNYTPICPNTFADAAGTGIGTNKIIVELGSLYLGDANEPCKTGTLFRIDVIPTKWPAECNVMLAENLTRGGVVDINGDRMTTLHGCKKGYTKCFPCWSPFNLIYRGTPNGWLAVGEPNCWCYPRQCHGDAQGGKEGSTKSGYWYVGSPDVTILTHGYLVLESPKGPGLQGEPNICADYARDRAGNTACGYYRVGSTDLTILAARYLVKESPKGDGIPSNCGGILVP